MRRQLHRGGELGADMLGLSKMTIYKGRAGGLMSGFQGWINEGTVTEETETGTCETILEVKIWFHKEIWKQYLWSRFSLHLNPEPSTKHVSILSLQGRCRFLSTWLTWVSILISLTTNCSQCVCQTGMILIPWNSSEDVIYFVPIPWFSPRNEQALITEEGELLPKTLKWTGSQLIAGL